jgi:WD40 repeat protein
VERLRADADAAVALLAFEPAQALASMIAVTEANLAALDGEPLASVQSGLFTVVRAAKERLRFDGHDQQVTCIAVDPEARWLVTGSRDRTVRLWPLSDVDATARILGRHDDEVRAVAVDPAGRFIASGGADGVVKLWRPDGSLIADLTGPTEAVLALLVHPGQGQVLAGCGDGLYGWSIDSLPDAVPERSYAGEQVTTLATHDMGGDVMLGLGDGRVSYMAQGSLWTNHWSDFIGALAYSPDGRKLANAFGGGTVWTHDIPPEGEIKPITFPVFNRGFISTLGFSPDGSALVLGDEDGRLRFIDQSGNPVHATQVAPGSILAIAVSPDGTWIAGTGGTSVLVWDWLPLASTVDSSKTPRVWDPHGDQVAGAARSHDFIAALAYTSNGEAIVSGGGDRTLRICDRAGNTRHVVEGAHEGGITTVACSPAGFPVIASGGRDNTVRLRDGSGRPLGAPLTGHRADVMSLAFHPQGTLLASGSEDCTIRLWTLDGQPVRTPIANDGSSVLALAFTPDGQTIAATGGDGAVRLYTVDGERIGEPFTGHIGHTWDVAFSPAGDCVLSCGSDRTVRRFDRTGAPVGNVLRGHTAGVRAGRFHPGGRMIVTVGEDGYLRTWTADGSPLTRPMGGQAGPLFALALDPTGRYAATGGEEGAVRVWQLGDWRDWLADARHRLRNHPAGGGQTTARGAER